MCPRTPNSQTRRTDYPKWILPRLSVFKKASLTKRFGSSLKTTDIKSNNKYMKIENKIELKK